MQKPRSNAIRDTRYIAGRREILRQPGVTPHRAALALRRLRTVLSLFRWQDRQEARRTVWYPTRRCLRRKRPPIAATLARFQRLRSRPGASFCYRTLWSWVQRYVTSGGAALLDYRGRGPRSRVAIDPALMARLLRGVAAGRSVVAMHRELEPVAMESGRAWPKLRTVQERVRRFRQLIPGARGPVDEVQPSPRLLGAGSAAGVAGNNTNSRPGRGGAGAAPPSPSQTRHSGDDRKGGR